jgi:hypothetical protein
MPTPNQSFEGLQAIHVEELKVFDALYAKEVRGYDMLRWAQGRQAKMMAAQQRHFWGKRELIERQEQEISEIRKVLAPQIQTERLVHFPPADMVNPLTTHIEKQTLKSPERLRQMQLNLPERLLKIQERALNSSGRLRQLHLKIQEGAQRQEQAQLHKLTLRQTECELDDVPMIFPVITE